MGGAMARAAAREIENELYLVNRHQEKAEKLQREIGGTVTDLASAVSAAPPSRAFASWRKRASAPR